VDRIYRYLLGRTGVPAIAEDLTSEVFLRAWNRLDQYRPSTRPFAAWLFRVARNMMIDEFRRERRMTELVDGRAPVGVAPSDPEAQAEERIRAAEVRRAMQILTEEQRHVLELRFFAGCSTREIAQALGKQEGAVRALQMRGLESLAGRLRQNDD
jgi:RNA polymerase sigma-70 factor (ECF subfamily)